MVALRFSNPTDLLERGFVPDVPTERVARIRGIDNDAVVANDLNGALQQAPLRIDGVHFEVLGHRHILRVGYRSVSGGGKMARSPWESGAAPRNLDNHAGTIRPPTGRRFLRRLSLFRHLHGYRGNHGDHGCAARLPMA